MILVAHIFIAFISIVQATYLLIRPSTASFKVAYGLITATLLSGTWLVISHDASLVQACLSGLLYLGVVSVALGLAHHKLAMAKNVHEDVRR